MFLQSQIICEHPVAIENEHGGGAIVFVCEHASCRLPEELGTLGLSDKALRSHIAWDIGALDLARRLATDFDGALCHQRFSRLAYDCNRPPDAESAIPVRSEIHGIPGNRALSATARAARVAAFYQPFRDSLAALLDQRAARGQASRLVTVHSFTPVYFGQQRSVDIGILHDSDSRLADAMLATAGQMGTHFRVRRNQPYAPADGVTHTLTEHGLARGIPNVMIEVRNDLLTAEASREAVVSEISRMLRGALAALEGAVSADAPPPGPEPTPRQRA